MKLRFELDNIPKEEVEKLIDNIKASKKAGGHTIIDSSLITNVLIEDDAE